MAEPMRELPRLLHHETDLLKGVDVRPAPDTGRTEHPCRWHLRVGIEGSEVACQAAYRLIAHGVIPASVVADRRGPLQREGGGEWLPRRCLVGEGGELAQMIGFLAQHEPELATVREIRAHPRMHGGGSHGRGQGWTSTRRSETVTSV